MFQLTQFTVGSALNIQYGYSATQNNGKITSQSDVISGEQIAYTYDALNRLASAQTTQTGGTQWGQSYTYDGFGNLTDQTLIKGAAPDVHVAYNYLTNRQTGDTADANGNIGSGNIYDLENRLVQPSGSTARYAYDANNKRMWRGDTGVDEITFWAGQRLSAYQLSVSGTTIYFQLKTTMVYFGGKPISKGTYYASGAADRVALAPIAGDRLGSIGKFYPYGTERPSATANDTEKFTGYFRDASTGLDYAQQRYEQPGMGRFMTLDPAPKIQTTDPGSWNRYVYVTGDPINRTDPNGLCPAVVGGITQGPSSNTNDFAASIGAMAAYPYDGGTVPEGIFATFASSLGAALGYLTYEGGTAAAAIVAAGQDSTGPINLFGFSGGGAAIANALPYVSKYFPDIASRIASITYASPGNFGPLATINGIKPTVILGTTDDYNDVFATIPASLLDPTPWNIIPTTCDHDAACEFGAANAAASAGTACNAPQTFSVSMFGDIQSQASAAVSAAMSGYYGGAVYYSPFNPYMSFGPNPIGCVTTPGLNGGPPDTECQ